MFQIRDATEDDSRFIAWAIAAAGRSTFREGLWEKGVPGSPEDRSDLLEWMSLSDVISNCHYSHFLVAETKGHLSGALAAFDSSDPSIFSVGAAVADAFEGLELPTQELPAVLERMSIIDSVRPTVEPDCWTIEWVATLPEVRRRGVCSGLLAVSLREAREKHYRRTQLSTYIENEIAIRAYSSVGYEIVDEKRSETFERAFGSRGIIRMAMDL